MGSVPHEAGELEQAALLTAQAVRTEPDPLALPIVVASIGALRAIPAACLPRDAFPPWKIMLAIEPTEGNSQQRIISIIAAPRANLRTYTVGGSCILHLAFSVWRVKQDAR